MRLVDYISRHPYQPAKVISNYDKELLVATLSNIHTDAKLIQQNHNISAITLNKLYYQNRCEVQNSSKHTEQVLSIDFAKPKLLIKDNRPLALQFHSSKPPLKQNSNFVSDPARRVRLTNINSAFAMRMYRSTMPSFHVNNPDSEQALRVRLTQNNASLTKQKLNQNHLIQNQLALAQPFHNLKVRTPNYTHSNNDFGLQVRFTHNKLTPAGHNPLLNDKQYICIT